MWTSLVSCHKFWTKRAGNCTVGPLCIDHACGIDSTNGSEKEKYWYQSNYKDILLPFLWLKSNGAVKWNTRLFVEAYILYF